MRIFIVFKNGEITKTIELLDEGFSFKEGEIILLQEKNTEIPCVVTKVQKILRKEGDNCTASMKVYITNAD